MLRQTIYPHPVTDNNNRRRRRKERKCELCVCVKQSWNSIESHFAIARCSAHVELTSIVYDSYSMKYFTQNQIEIRLDIQQFHRIFTIYVQPPHFHPISNAVSIPVLWLLLTLAKPLWLSRMQFKKFKSLWNYSRWKWENIVCKSRKPDLFSKDLFYEFNTHIHNSFVLNRLLRCVCGSMLVGCNHFSFSALIDSVWLANSVAKNRGKIQWKR